MTVARYLAIGLACVGLLLAAGAYVVITAAVLS